MASATVEAHQRSRSSKWPLTGDKERLTKLYSNGLSLDDIANEAGCSRMAVRSAFKYFGIETRSASERTEHFSKKFSGPNNWHWKGGIYNGKVMGITGGSHTRSKLRKKLIAERGHRCEWCGRTRGRIEVHHVIPFRFSQSHEDSNVLLLCVKTCHSKADEIFNELAGKLFSTAGSPGLKEALDAEKRLRSGTT